jgi:pyruvate carboxylase
MINWLKNLFLKPLLQDAHITAPARDDAPRIFARLFSSDDGQKVLSYLRVTVNARVGGPEAGESQLRYQDGQRGLLQTINGLIEQGR